MNVKKKYGVGETVWIYGIRRNNDRSTEGTVIKVFNIEGYVDTQYVIEIPTEIEPLLEIRTWHTMSQTKDGHVGSLRESFSNPDAAHRMLARTGMAFISLDDEEFTDDGHDGMGSISEEDEISPDAIHAALEQSQKDSEHGPLVTKSNKPRRPYYKKKKA